MSRPLVDFRAAVNDLLDKGVSPTATNMAQYGYEKWVDSTGRTFKDGHLAKAREEELLAAGWRRVAYRPEVRNFRWLPLTQRGGRKVRKTVKTLFRIGDTVRIFDSESPRYNDVVTVDSYFVDGVAVAGGEYMKDEFLILQEANPKYPLKIEHNTDELQIW